MKLVVNKQEAELLKDIQVNTNEKSASILLTENNVKIARIGFKGIADDGRETCKDVFIGIDNNGEVVIGYRNQYGNGYREFNMQAFEKLLWQNGRSTDNLKLLKENKESYTLS